MRFTALLAALALVAACGVEPEPDRRARIEAVVPAPFASQNLFEVKAIDVGSTFLERLTENIPLERRRDVEIGYDTWEASGHGRRSDVYLAAPNRAALESALADAPRLDVPMGRKLAFGQLDDGRQGEHDLSALTAQTVGSKIAVLVGGTVVFEPVVASAINGGRAQLTFGGS